MNAGVVGTVQFVETETNGSPICHLGIAAGDFGIVNVNVTRYELLSMGVQDSSKLIGKSCRVSECEGKVTLKNVFGSNEGWC